MAKKSSTIDIKTASREDLLKMLKEQKDKLTALRFDVVAGKVKNVNEVRTMRKNIARVNTQLSTLSHAV